MHLGCRNTMKKNNREDLPKLKCGDAKYFIQVNLWRFAVVHSRTFKNIGGCIFFYESSCLLIYYRDINK